jgi:5-(carboxyamino)imidazole ribonucleotide mutase
VFLSDSARGFSKPEKTTADIFPNMGNGVEEKAPNCDRTAQFLISKAGRFRHHPRRAPVCARATRYSMSNDRPVVAILMGSDSDWETVAPAAETLKKFGVVCEVRVCSAHRTPDAAAEFAKGAAAGGLRILIAAAGSAAHLAGVLAAHTTLPVIGVPLKGGALDGLDALLATVQMPAGIPVATVALGKAGAINAALLAVQILALADPALQARLVAHKAALAQKVAEGNQRIQTELRKMT